MPGAAGERHVGKQGQHDKEDSQHMAQKRKYHTEADTSDDRLRMMKDILARMQEAKDNRQYDKIPGLEREFDEARGQ